MTAYWWLDVLFLHDDLLLCHTGVYQVLEASAKAVIEKTRPALEEALRETGVLLGFGHVVGWPAVRIFKNAESPRNLEILVFPMHPKALSFPAFLF